MKLLIVSGLSGSGKSIVLDTLEDCGYYCIDNLPITLLPGFASQVMPADPLTYAKTAIGIDARNQSKSLLRFSEILSTILSQGIDCEIIFLQAEEDILLKRYSETRRKHPLTNSQVALKEALGIEKEMLKTVLNHANIVMDTSRTTVQQLRALIKSHLEKDDEQHLSLQFQSFGFKHGVPLDVDFMFDVRCLPNPYWDATLRGFTGKDQPVIDFLNKSEDAKNLFQDICLFLEKWVERFDTDNRSYLTIGIGCTGGQHRSVYIVEMLVKYFSKGGLNVITRHRELR
ncbi:MAG: RNase adapter RapZ [Methylococcales bacterium]